MPKKEKYSRAEKKGKKTNVLEKSLETSHTPPSLIFPLRRLRFIVFHSVVSSFSVIPCISLRKITLRLASSLQREARCGEHENEVGDFAKVKWKEEKRRSARDTVLFRTNIAVCLLHYIYFTLFFAG